MRNTMELRERKPVPKLLLVKSIRLKKMMILEYSLPKTPGYPAI
jgi:hypothetical protein